MESVNISLDGKELSTFLMEMCIMLVYMYVIKWSHEPIEIISDVFMYLFLMKIDFILYLFFNNIFCLQTTANIYDTISILVTI